MTKWRETELSKVIDLFSGGTPKTSVLEYWGGCIPWLSVADFNIGKKYVYQAEKSVTKLGVEKSSTNILSKGDLIISARGTVGVVAVLGQEMAFNQSCYGIRAKSQMSYNDFIYYLLKAVVTELQQISHGGVFDTITRDTFKEIKVLLPPLPEQRAIAGVLSSLDNKIDLLHRQNKTLEALAETLFFQWCIEETCEVCEEGLLGDLVVISSGKGLKRSEYIGDGTYQVFGANGKIGRTDKFLFDEKLIFTGRVGTLGNVFINEGKAWFSDNTLVFKVTKIEYFYFIYFFLKQAHLENINVGSTQPLIRQSDIKKLELTIPSNEILQKFSVLASNFFKQIGKNQTQIQTLENLRDMLLPKLMSGNVRVAYDGNA